MAELRRLPNRSRAERRRAAHHLRGLVVAAAALGLVPAQAGAQAACQPFSFQAGAQDGGAGGVLDTLGVLPSVPPLSEFEGDPEVDGRIVRLPSEGLPGPAPATIPGEALLVLPKLENGELAQDFTLAPEARILDSFWSPVLCATLVRIGGPDDATPEQLVPRAEPPAVVLPHPRYRTSATETKPAPAGVEDEGPDPYRPFQIGLAQLGVMAARGLTSGQGATIAVLDSAPDLAHRELRRVRLVEIQNGPPTEPALHGTLVVGVVAAIENNAFGITGFAPSADVVAIPVCKPIGNGLSDECTLFDVARGIDRAWEEEAQVVNLALAGPPHPVLQRAVTRLGELGAVVVAAAGNSGSAAPSYPAAYPGVVGVGAVDPQGRLATASNRGPWVALDATGVEVISTVPDDAFAFASGTSLAAAQVSGVLGLLSAVLPDPGRMRQALLATSRGTARTAEVALPGARPATPLAATVCDVLASLGTSCTPPP